MGIKIHGQRDKHIGHTGRGGSSELYSCSGCNTDWFGCYNETHKPECPCYAEWQEDLKLPSIDRSHPRARG